MTVHYEMTEPSPPDGLIESSRPTACLGETYCEPPDGEVMPDGRQYKYEGRHHPECPRAQQGQCISDWGTFEADVCGRPTEPGSRFCSFCTRASRRADQARQKGSR